MLRVPSAAMEPSTRASSDVAQNLASPAFGGRPHMYSVSSMLAACTEFLATPSRARALGSEDVENGMESATWRGSSPSGALAAKGKYKVMVLTTYTASSRKKSPWAKYSSVLWSRTWGGMGDESLVGPEGERSPHINHVREYASATVSSFGLFAKLVSAP